MVSSGRRGVFPPFLTILSPFPTRFSSVFRQRNPENDALEYAERVPCRGSPADKMSSKVTWCVCRCMTDRAHTFVVVTSSSRRACTMRPTRARRVTRTLYDIDSHRPSLESETRSASAAFGHRAHVTHPSPHRVARIVDHASSLRFCCAHCWRADVLCCVCRMHVASGEGWTGVGQRLFAPLSCPHAPPTLTPTTPRHASPRASSRDAVAGLGSARHAELERPEFCPPRDGRFLA